MSRVSCLYKVANRKVETVPRLITSLILRRRLSTTTPKASANPKSRVLESPFGREVAVPSLSLTEYVWRDVCVWEDKKLVTCAESEESFTYKEGRSLIHGFARSLVGKLGLSKGDVIAIVAPNVPDYIFSAHGAIEAGLTVTFINPLYTPEETGRQLMMSKARLVATIPALLPLINAVSKNLPAYRGTVLFGPETAAEVGNVFNMRALAAEGLATEGVFLPQIESKDIAILPFSSGTTGMPKGVMLTHGNCTSNLCMSMHPEMRMALYTKGSVQDGLLTVLPFFHIYGFNCVLNTTICSGQHLITIPRFTPEGYLAALIKYRPTGLSVVPAIMQFLVSHPAVKSEHLSSVRYVMTGAAPAGKALMDKMNKKAGKTLDVRQGYGMTETSPATLFCSKATPADKAGSVGQLMPGTKARVVDLTTGEDLGPNQSGELYVQGPQVMSGYLNNPEATKEIIDEQQWLHTGDVAFYDEDYYFYIVDRTKELIKVKGNQVSPTELEGILTQIKGIMDAAVIGIPDERSGEVPRAFIVLRPGAQVTEEDIKAFVEPKVAPYKKLAGGVVFIDAIPRNPGGKILRNQLKAMAK